MFFEQLIIMFPHQSKGVQRMKNSKAVSSSQIAEYAYEVAVLYVCIFPSSQSITAQLTTQVKEWCL